MASSTVPSMGAALEAFGVQTSGMWPSPANRPEVGSIPIQPAPGKNTSAQAWKSAESLCGPLGPSDRALVRRQLNQIPGDEAGRDSQMSENLHQQPRRITAGARALFKGLLACLHARIQPRHIFDFVSHSPIQVNQKTDRSSLLAGRASQEKPGAEARPARPNNRVRDPSPAPEHTRKGSLRLLVPEKNRTD